jgi:hypothetical protein
MGVRTCSWAARLTDEACPRNQARQAAMNPKLLLLLLLLNTM